MKLFRSILFSLALTFTMSSPLWADAALIQAANQAFRNKDYTKANAMLDQHLAKYPNDQNALYAKAMCLNKLGFFKKSMIKLDRLIRLSPQNHYAKELYAMNLTQEVYRLINLNNFEQALKECDYALGMKVKSPASGNMLMVLAQEPGINYAKGVTLFERWAQNSDDADHQAALDAWKQECEINPVSATGELLSGIYAFDGYDYQRAMQHFTVAQQLRPNNPYTHMWMGLTNTALGEYETALEQLNSATDIFGSNPSLHIHIADTYRALNRFDEALAEYNNALELRPNDEQVYASLAELFLISGKLNEGVNYFNDAVKANPGGFAERFRLASFLHEAGMSQDALAEYDRCLQIGGITPEQQANVKIEKAIINIENDKTDVAAEIIKGVEQAINVETHPRYNIYLALTANQIDARDLAIHRALSNTGAYSLWNQADAFYAWALLEKSRKQPLRAMEMLNQSWQRTAPNSSYQSRIQSLFKECRTQALVKMKADEKAAGKLRSKDPLKYSETVEAIKNNFTTIESMELSNPGVLLSRAVQSNTGISTIIPAELEPNLQSTITTALPISSWMHIKAVPTSANNAE